MGIYYYLIILPTILGYENGDHLNYLVKCLYYIGLKKYININEIPTE